ncbi:MAG: regulator of chromosome condensation 1/beta-lactamase-inhibitor protein II [Olpidium bornovanus]|uniref:Regulator of chromosome condensation 1/beta-lactamase-inhibitor protein II n=1 Tax=Olpidium bornovanus TaxID=278681 RepID=A0A8H7ZU88_9FUNG|nr:MAG: regulator of chromosome condensation 1/beta-lactamase-inhibitor protein II [Olpidium bornovanus]
MKALLLACGSNLFGQLSSACPPSPPRGFVARRPSSPSACERRGLDPAPDATWPALRPLPGDRDRALCASWDCAVFWSRDGKVAVRAGYDRAAGACACAAAVPLADPGTTPRRVAACEPFVCVSAAARVVVVDGRRKERAVLEFPGGAADAAVRSGDGRRDNGFGVTFVHLMLSLGHGSVDDVDEPTVVADLQGVRITQIACGERHSVALSGDVYTFGCNAMGQLGRSTASADAPAGGSSPGLVDEGLPDDKDAAVAAIACGSHHTAAVTADGRLWTCGWVYVARRYAPRLVITAEARVAAFGNRPETGQWARERRSVLFAAGAAGCFRLTS